MANNNRRSIGKGRRRGARWRRITFQAPQALVCYEVAVVARVTAGVRPQITRKQDEELTVIEAQHGGVVPLTAEEYDALNSGDMEIIRQLARKKGSALRFLYDLESDNEPRRFTLVPMREVDDPSPRLVEPVEDVPGRAPEPLSQPARPGVIVLGSIRSDTVTVPLFRQEGDKYVLNLPVPRVSDPSP